MKCYVSEVGRELKVKQTYKTCLKFELLPMCLGFRNNKFCFCRHLLNV